MGYLFNIRNMNKYILIIYRDGIIKHLGVTDLSELKLDQNKCVQNKNNNDKNLSSKHTILSNSYFLMNAVVHKAKLICKMVKTMCTIFVYLSKMLSYELLFSNLIKLFHKIRAN